MKRFIRHLDDIVFQSGRPCRRYVPYSFRPRKYRHMQPAQDPHNADHNYYLEQMHAAIDCLFLEESGEDIAFAMWRISDLSTRLLRFASRRLHRYLKKKEERSSE